MRGILHIQYLEHPAQLRKPCQTDSPSRQPLHYSHKERKRRELKMTEYEFTSKFSLQNAQSDPQEYVELLGGNGCDDALIGIGQRGRIAFSFTRESTSAYEAVSSAREDIREVLPNARLVEAAPDLVGLTETAEEHAPTHDSRGCNLSCTSARWQTDNMASISDSSLDE